jgi:hypothetical protein
MSQPHDPKASNTYNPADYEPIELADDTPGRPGVDSQTQPDAVYTDQHCISCGYLLRGLNPSGTCPECGTSVAESLRGDLLFYRNIEYVRTLKKGLSYILNGILLYIILIIVSLFAAQVAAGLATPVNIQLLSSGGSLGISILILVGWWLFTNQDPGVPLHAEPKARKITRIAVIASVVTALLSFLTQGLLAFVSSELLLLLSGLVGLVSLAAFVTQFFAGMLYCRGLSRRLPSEKLYKRAKSRMIACPIWATVGLFLFGLGPLIALVLYWNYLDMIRKALKTIIAAIESGATEPPTIIVKR